MSTSNTLDLNTASTGEHTYYAYFDLLRAVLAFLVFVSHAGALPQSMEHIGGYAVITFFALSGYLVGGILIDMRARNNFWDMLPRFYFNRCLRIWVPYYILIISYISLMLLRGMWSDELELRLIPMLTYTHNLANKFWGLSESVIAINHAWSLAVEEQFYLVCPLLLFFLRLRIAILIVMLALSVLLPIVFGIGYFAAIFFGVIAAVLKRELAEGTWYVLRILTLPLGIFGALYLLLNEFNRDSIWVALCCTFIVIGSAFEKSKNNFWYLLGAMSYSFYLYHWLGLYFANPIGKWMPEMYSSFTVFFIALAIALVISYSSVRLVEWPLLRQRDVIATKAPWLVRSLSSLAFIVTLIGFLHLSSVNGTSNSEIL